MNSIDNKTLTPESKYTEEDGNICSVQKPTLITYKNNLERKRQKEEVNTFKAVIKTAIRQCTEIEGKRKEKREHKLEGDKFVILLSLDKP